MRLLLDTHIAIWALVAHPRLSGEARELIVARETQVYVSAATIWEIAIKHGLGKGGMPFSGEDAIRYFREAGYQSLDVKAEHAAMVERLPRIHSDPFDRLLVAQAIAEPMYLLTHDERLAAYGPAVRLV